MGLAGISLCPGGPLLRDTPGTRRGGLRGAPCYPSRWGKRPSWVALTAAWTRSETPNLKMMCRTCFFMVLELIKRLREISWLLCPRAIRRSTSTSRGVNVSGSVGAGCPPLANLTSGRLSGSFFDASSISCRSNCVATSWSNKASPARTFRTASIISWGLANLRM